MTKKEIRHYVVCNLSYATTSALIETKLYSKVIANMVEFFYNMPTGLLDPKAELEYINSQICLRALINEAFLWEDTPEGYEYWNKIFHKYYNYIIRF